MYIKEVQYCSLAPIIGFSNVVQVKMIKLWSGDGGIGSLIVYGIIVVYQLHIYDNGVLRYTVLTRPHPRSSRGNFCSS